jgi:hypothetical protein
MNKIVCIVCDKNIRAFKTRTDWQGREMHLKCWKEKENEEKLKILFEKVQMVHNAFKK